MQSALAIVCDGACLNNGRGDSIAAWALGKLDEQRELIKKSIRRGIIKGNKHTNNIAELTAIRESIKVSPRDIPTIIYSDSYYSINALTVWYIKWRENNWKASSNEPVKNKELIQEILSLLESKPLIKFQHIRGHSANLGKIHFAHDVIDHIANDLARGRLNQP